MPEDIDLDDVQTCADSPEIVARVAEVVQQWAPTISQTLQNLATTAESPEPLAELELWRSRSAALSALYEQAHSNQAKTCMQILQLAGHTALASLQYQLAELFRCYSEARDNAVFLATTERYLKTLSTGQIESTQAALPPLLAALRMVWVTSRHFNSEDKMVPLLQRVAWRLIQTIRERVRLPDMLLGVQNHSVDEAQKLLESAVSMLDTWKESYTQASAAIEASGTNYKWEFDQRLLFGDTSRVRERLVELQGVFTTLGQFDTALSGPLSSFTDVATDLIALKQRVRDLIDNLARGADLFSADHTAAWQQLLEKFNEGASHVNDELGRFLDASFNSMRSVTEALQRLLSSPDAAQTRKTVDVLNRFKEEVDHTLLRFEELKANPPIARSAPQVSGSIAWCRSLFTAHKAAYDLIRQLPAECQALDAYADAKKHFMMLPEALSAYENERLNAWISDASHDTLTYLRRPLLILRDAATGQPSIPEETILSASWLAGQKKKREAAALTRPRASLKRAGAKNSCTWPVASEGTGLELAQQVEQSGVDIHLGGSGSVFSGIVITPDFYDHYDICVNFAPELDSLIREALALDGYGFTIPEETLVTALQSAHYEQARELMQDILDNVRTTFTEMPELERALLTPQFASTLGQLVEGLQGLSWTALSLDDFIIAGQRAAARLGDTANQINRIAAGVNASVDRLARSRLIPESPSAQVIAFDDESVIANLPNPEGIPANFRAALAKQRKAELQRRVEQAGVTQALNEPFLVAEALRQLPDSTTFRDRMVASIKRRAENALESYTALPPALMKIEETITGTCTGHCSLMREYYAHQQARVEQSLLTMVNNSLAKFQSLLSVSESQGSRKNLPLFSVSAVLSADITTAPSPQEIQKILNSIIEAVIRGTSQFIRWREGTCLALDPVASTGTIGVHSPGATALNASLAIAQSSLNGAMPLSPLSFYHTISHHDVTIRARTDTSRVIQMAFADLHRQLNHWSAVAMRESSAGRTQVLERLASKHSSATESALIELTAAAHDAMSEHLGVAEAMRQSLALTAGGGEPSLAPAELDLPPALMQVNFIFVSCRALVLQIRSEALDWVRGYGRMLLEAALPMLRSAQAEVASLQQGLSVQPATVVELRQLLQLIVSVVGETGDRERRFRSIAHAFEVLAQAGYVQQVGAAVELLTPGGTSVLPTGLVAPVETSEFVAAPQDEYGGILGCQNVVSLATIKAVSSTTGSQPVSLTQVMLEEARSLPILAAHLCTQARKTEVAVEPIRQSFRAVTASDAQTVEHAVENMRQTIEEHSPDDIPSDGTATDAQFKACVDLLNQYQLKLKDLKNKVVSTQSGQRLFDLPVTQFPAVAEIEAQLQGYQRVFSVYNAVAENLSSWNGLAFHTVEVEGLQKSVDSMLRKLVNLPEPLHSLNCYGAVHSRLMAFSGSLPLVALLRSDALRPRHWIELQGLVPGSRIDSQITLGTLLSIGLHEHTAEIETIVASATKQAQLEKALTTISSEWRGQQLDMVPHQIPGGPVSMILHSTADISVALEDSLVQLQSMISSRYAAPFQSEMHDWLMRLSTVADVLEVWMNAQSTWLYLESVFAGSDLRRQLPEESSRFDRVAQTMTHIGADAHKLGGVVDVCTTQGMLASLKGLVQLMEQCQKGLSDYLQTKRSRMPRLYFISDTDLLSVLGSREATAVQLFVPAMFDGAQELVFSAGAHSALGFTSPEGETLTFVRPVPCDSAPEVWLSGVAEEMRATVHSLLRAAVQSYASTPRGQWLDTQNSMCGLSVSQVWWTWEVEHALQQLAQDHKALRNLEKLQQQQITELVRTVRRTDLTSLQRQKLNAQIITDVHARDTTSHLIRDAVSSIDAFDWISCIRSYWSDDQLRICQCRASFVHAYEYLGASSRLVITPLTDRSYIILTTALSLCMGGNPAGPAGTGKTETVKDLSKTLGRMCAVYCCGEGLDHTVMARVFSGLAEAGVVGCMDEINRLEPAVLSVVAAQVRAIQTALQSAQQSFQLDGRVLSLNPSCGIFITMNPGYAGRSELPDSLKALFRPVVMVVPDLLMIAEIMLFSEGFTEAYTLAGKLVLLYRLAKSQLSPQSHYDWSLRAIKTVLIYAGALKRSQPQLSEACVIMSALSECNIPKFVAADLPLFSALLQDLFPGLKPRDAVVDDFRQAVISSLEARSLEPLPTVVDKVVQLRESLSQRWSVMLVGGSCVGKSTVLHVYLDAVQQLGIKTQLVTIDPKAQSVTALFGCLDPSTREWCDGVLSHYFRELNKQAPPEPTEARIDVGAQGRIRILCLDGTVDALWVEHLNSVMDDSKLLTLANNERIALAPYTKLVFETPDLSYASPATVSRVAMVWVPAQTVTPQAIFNSFANEIQERAPKASEIWTDCYSRIGRPLVAALYEGQPTQMMLGLPALASMRQFTAMLRSFIDLPDTMDLDNAEAARLQLTLPPILEALFIFCLVNSVAAAVNVEDRNSVDTIIRESAGIPPASAPCGAGVLPQESLFDCSFLLLQGRWTLFSQAIPEFAPPDDAAAAEILVPTAETTRLEHLVQLGLDAGIPVLIAGPSGACKTSVATALLNRLPQAQWASRILALSTRTSVSDVYTALNECLEKRLRGIYAPPGGRRLVFMIDDLQLPTRDNSGSQSTSAFLRQMLEHSGMYGNDRVWRSLQQVVVLATVRPEVASPVDPRLLSRFLLVQTPDPTTDSLREIFSSLLKYHLTRAQFGPEFTDLVSPLVQSSLQVYEQLQQALPSGPKSYLNALGLRDLSRVFCSMFAATPASIERPEQLVRCWNHEIHRSFVDRLSDPVDSGVAERLITEAIRQQPTLADMAEYVMQQPLIFGDYGSAAALLAPTEEDSDESSEESEEEIKPQRFYEDLGTIEQARPPLQDILDIAPDIAGGMVLFPAAVEHVSRLIRVLRQPCGHSLLVGAGGCGKQTCARLAIFAAGSQFHTIHLRRGYSTADFRADLMAVCELAGTRNASQTLVLTEGQLTEEADSFLEAVSGVITSGLPPGLFGSEDRQRVMDALREDPQLASQPAQTLWSVFQRRCYLNIHIILIFVPGHELRNRLLAFPSLLSGCVVDYYAPWTEEALMSVAEAHLQPAPLTEEERTLLAPLFVQLYRKVPVTPSPRYFVDAIHQYIDLLEKRRATSHAEIQRFEAGIDKLKQAAQEVSVMQEDLAVQKVELDTKTQACESLLERITARTTQAEATATEAEAQERKIQEERAWILTEKAEAETMLAEATPALEAAADALNNLSKDDVTVIRSYVTPPPPVQLVCECVVCLRQLPDVSWKGAKAMLAGAGFLKSLLDFDKDSVPAKVVANVETNYLKKHADVLNQTTMATISAAGAGLLAWVEAIVHYSHVARGVAPKRKRVEEAEAQLDRANRELQETKAKLSQLRSELQSLNRDLERATADQLALRERADVMTRRLDAARRLVDGLGGEAERWDEEARILRENSTCLVGQTALHAATLAYLGPCSFEVRRQLCSDWEVLLSQSGLPAGEGEFDPTTLIDEVTALAWRAEGLPADMHSVLSGILATMSPRFAYCVDPQEQATMWLRKHLPGLVVVSPGDDLLRQLELCISYGKPLLLDNCSDVDPVLMPVLQKKISVGSGGRRFVTVGDKELDWDENFQLFIATKASQPNLSSDLQASLNVVLFTVTPSGLEGQLLDATVAHERADLAERRQKLVIDMSEGEARLKGFEDSLLRELAAATGMIVDNTELITTLESTRAKAAELKQQLAQMRQTATELSRAREAYRPVARRGASLFFAMDSLRSVSPMSYFALSAFLSVFERSLIDAAPETRVEGRVARIVAMLTQNVVAYTALGLTEEMRLAFFVIVAVSTLSREAGVMSASWLPICLTGATSLEGVELPPDAPAWLTTRIWADAGAISHIEPLAELRNALLSADWSEWLQADEPERLAMPDAALQELVSDGTPLAAFLRMVVVRLLRVDRFPMAAIAFARAALTPRVCDIPVLNLENVLRLSTPRSPILLVVTPGSDPSADVINLAAKMERSSRLRLVSLGQGQEEAATTAVQQAMRQGQWVLLQNGHLLVHWLPTLERLLTADVHVDFRVWITSAPTSQFPLSLLQQAVKVVTGAPSGLRRSVQSSLVTVAGDPQISCAHPAFYPLVYVISYLHAMLRERSHYGKLGWNVIYDFSFSDLTTSCLLVAQYLNQELMRAPDVAALASRGDATARAQLLAGIPWTTLRFLVGEVVYGGRVTDGFDHRVLATYLSEYFGDFIFDEWQPFHFYNGPETTADDEEAPDWSVPQAGCAQEQLDQLAARLPTDAAANVLGLHQNAAASYQAQAGRELLQTLSAMNMRSESSSTVQSARLAQLVADTATAVPDAITERVTGLMPTDVVLAQEITRYNTLVATIKDSLAQLQRVYAGDISFTPELEAISLSVSIGQVPERWRSLAPQTVKRLPEWLADLRLRRSGLALWLSCASGCLPPAIWLAGLHSPESLLSALTQSVCHKYGWALDTATIATKVSAYTDPAQAPPLADGFYASGLWLEGAAWDSERGQLCEQERHQTRVPLPLLEVTVILRRSAVSVGTFRTPVYVTSQRCDAMGRGLVFEADLHTDVHESFWVLRGVALTLNSSE